MIPEADGRSPEKRPLGFKWDSVPTSKRTVFVEQVWRGGMVDIRIK